MIADEGVIKYDCDWTRAPLPPGAPIAELDRSRRLLFAAGLIGLDRQCGIAFGNLSIRWGQHRGQFLVSGTQTGHLAATDASHYALVTGFSIDDNVLSCTGSVPASSESMTHAAVYELDPGIGAIVHVHSGELWHEHLGRLPTTSADVAYGTPAMAQEFRRLYSETALPATRIAIMGGHEGGLLSFGKNLEEATKTILGLQDPGAFTPLSGSCA